MLELEMLSDKELMTRWLNELDNITDHQSLADDYLNEIKRRGREDG